MNQAIMAELLTLAKKVDTYEVYAASGTTYWSSTTTYEATVPVSKRWYFLYGMVDPDASATVAVHVKNSADKILTLLTNVAAGTAIISVPNTVASSTTLNPDGLIVMDAGDYIGVTFGAAQGTGADVNFSFLEVDA